MGEWRVRPYRRDDRVPVQGLVAAVLEAEFGIPRLREDLEHIRENYGPSGTFLVVEAHKAIVGTGGTRVLPAAAPLPEEVEAGAAVGLLKRLYVTREWRGRGLGMALLEALEAHCRRVGCKGLFIDTAPQMEGGRRFYQRRGFREVATPLVPPEELRGDICLRYFWKQLR